MSAKYFCLMGYFLMLVLGCFMDGSFSVWVCMEFGLYFLMVYLICEGVDSSSLVVYYVFQTLGSCLLLWGLLLNEKIAWVGLFMKLGMFPFSVWVFKFISSLSYSFGVVVVFGFQKLLPLVFMMKFMVLQEFVVLVSLMSCLLGMFFMMSSNSFMMLLSGSSIMHTSWIVVYSMMGPSLLWVYYFLYILMLVWMLVLKSKSAPLGLMVFSSVPPLVGFVLKWVVFCDWGLMWQMVLMLFILFSGVSVLGYMRWSMAFLMSSMKFFEV